MKYLTRFLSAMTLSLATLVAANSPLQAQESPGKLVRQLFITPKAGHAEQYRAAVAKYRAWCQENGDSWNWMVYLILSGENSGSYVHVSPGHTWKDFEARREFDAISFPKWQEMVAEHVDSMRLSDFEIEEKLSRVKPGPPKPLGFVTTYYMKPFATMVFVRRFQEVSKLISSQDSPPDVIALRLLNGGQPRIAFVHPVGSAAEVERLQVTIGKTINDLGPRAETLAKELADLTEREETAYIMLQPELSSSPRQDADVTAK